jgi:hypothetical protein
MLSPTSISRSTPRHELHLRFETAVTDPFFGVVPNAGDQSDNIIAALGYLGGNKTVDYVTKYFSHTAYFPAGTYLISKQLLNVASIDGAAITIRGDGPATVLKFLYNWTAALSTFTAAGSSWVLNTNDFEHYPFIYAVPSSVGEFFSTEWEIDIPAMAVLHVDRKLRSVGYLSGTKFRVYKDGTLLYEDQGIADNVWIARTIACQNSSAQEKARFKFSLHVPTTPSIYRAVYVDKVTVTSAQQGGEVKVFSITGTGSAASPQLAPNFTFKDMTLDGGAVFDPHGRIFSGWNVNWFYFDRVSLVNMNHVIMQNTFGSGIQGHCWWDSLLQDVQFANCGRPSDMQASMELACTGATTDWKDFNGCNNLKFIGCRWEGDLYIACRLNEHTREAFFLGCKWHGKLTQDNNDNLNVPVVVSYPHIDVFQKSNGVNFTGCRMANWGNTHLRASGAAGVTVTGSSITGAGPGQSLGTGIFGIEPVNCTGSAITGNSFPSGGESTNLDGNVSDSGGRGNVIANNGQEPPGVALIRDEFATGTTTSGAIGDLGWILENDGTASSTVSVASATVHHPGVIQMDTSTVAGYSGLMLNSSHGTILDPANFFDVTFILKFSASDATAGFSWGLTNLTAHDFDPANGIYFQKAVSGADAGHWLGVCRSNGTVSKTSAVATADTFWHSFRIRRVLSTPKIGFSIDGGTERLVVTDVPTAGMNPFLVCHNNSASKKTVSVDYFEMQGTSLSR